MENIFIYVFLFLVVVGIMLSLWERLVTTVYTIDEEEKTMDVHCKLTTVFILEIPDSDEYLRVILNNFFSTHQMVTTEMNKLRVE